MTLTESVGG